jgi:transposase
MTDERGKILLRKQLRRSQMAVFFANLAPCLIGMEACASAHHWGRTLQSYGHTVRLMASQFVKPYVKTNKNDAADAEAICEAVPELLEHASNELPAAFRQLIERLTEHLKELDLQVKDFERQIIAWHRASELSRKLEAIPGIGPLAASALVASIADPHSFDNGRQVSAWLGLVPRQHSSGGKPTLLGMSKRGDAYLRTLLIHGARSAILAAKLKVDNTNGWLTNLLSRRHPNIAAVALANKNVRTAWAMLARGREFKADYVPSRIAA